MYKNILVTVDINATASWQKALPQAVEMCRTWGAALHVLCVVPSYGTPLVEGFFPDDYQKKARAKAVEQLDALVKAQVPAELSAKSHVRTGTVHDEILAAVRENGADLVIMASHAPDHMRDFLVGSNADRVVRRSPVSILVVR